MNNKIILVNQSSSYLTIDIANVYSEHFDEVVLLTGNIGEDEKYLLDKVIINKLTKYNKSSTLKRVYTWIISFIQILFKLLFKYRKYEVVYVTNPPISYLASLFVNNPFSIIVFDTYPDALRNIGIKEGHWLYKIWSRWNRNIFKKAKKIYTLSEGMAEQLTHYVERKNIKVVPLWPASESFKPIEKNNNPFVLEHNLQEKFIVMYSGNMGFTHSVETIIEVANLLKNNNTIHFLLIGDGMKKNELIKLVEKYKLNNCTFLDWQPTEMLPYSLASADIGVVTLNEETALTSVPSKTFNLMAVGAPLLCIAPDNSEIAKIIGKYNNGVVYSAKDLDNIVVFINNLVNDSELKQKMTENSLTAAKSYTKENAKMYLS